MVGPLSSISIALTSPQSVQMKVCKAGRAPSAGVALTNVIGLPHISHGGSQTSSGFSDMAALGAHYGNSPKFHSLIVNPLNFGWNETRSARVLVIRIQNIVTHGNVWILECVPTAICDEALRSGPKK